VKGARRLWRSGLFDTYTVSRTYHPGPAPLAGEASGFFFLGALRASSTSRGFLLFLLLRSRIRIKPDQKKNSQYSLLLPPQTPTALPSSPHNGGVGISTIPAQLFTVSASCSPAPNFTVPPSRLRFSTDVYCGCGDRPFTNFRLERTYLRHAKSALAAHTRAHDILLIFRGFVLHFASDLPTLPGQATPSACIPHDAVENGQATPPTRTAHQCLSRSNLLPLSVRIYKRLFPPREHLTLRECAQLQPAPFSVAQSSLRFRASPCDSCLP